MKARAPRRGPRAQTASQTTKRCAERREWDPATQQTVTIKRTRLPIAHPRFFIRDVADRLVPEWRIQGVLLSSYDHQRSCKLDIRFGTDENGRRTTITVRLRKSDAPVFAAYLLGCHHVAGLLLITDADLPVTPPDDDGGQTLTVPSASDSLAHVPALRMIQ